jgi:2-hydroxycyclohexanecarboxyl-CoA dehydrogenase
MSDAPAESRSASLNGRRALVIGGGGIGAQVCLDLAAAGSTVFFTYHRSREVAEELAQRLTPSGCAGFAQLDAADDTAVTDVVNRAAAALGGVDILVITAGHRHELRLFHETEAAAAREIVDTELLAVMNTVRAVLPIMRDSNYGRIVVVGSDSGKVGSSGDAASSAARGGVIAFGKAIARENAALDITANVVCPGPTDTALLQDMLASDGLTGKVMNGMVKAIPKRRRGTATEVASAVLFLAADGAGYITGQAISVSGGLTMS